MSASITQFMGGGFGSKFGPDVQGLICARLAKMASAPVKLMLDRKEEHLATGNRPSAFARIKAGCDANGVLTFFEADSWGTGGAGAGSNFPLPYLYVFPNRTRRHRNVYINAGLQRAMRAPGHPQGCFLTELMMDELADRARIDPLEFRLRNLPPDAPERTVENLLPDGRTEDWVEPPTSHRRSDTWTHQEGDGLLGTPLGRSRARDARAPGDSS